MTIKKNIVSFILPSHNRAPILQKVLEHIEMLEYDFAYEIIVIDNNSQDDSVKMVRSKFPGVRLVGLEKNLGAVSRNIGISTARGKYIVMLDDDSYPCPGTVECGIRIFENDIDHKIGCIAFNIRQEDGSYETSGIYTHFTGCGAMFHSDAFRQIGEYPQDYLYYAEEYDLSCRIWNHGLKILNFKELEVVHLKTVMNRDFEKIICQLVRNNIMLWSKYLPMEHAKRQIGTELWRYHKIALKEEVFAGYEKGKKEGGILQQKYASMEEYKVSLTAIKKILDTENIAFRINRLREAIPGRNILIFNIGKLLHYVLEELQSNGFNVIGIVDDNTHMQADSFEGIPIFSRDRFKSNTFDAVVIGSSSLALNDTYERQLIDEKINRPIIRLCDYDCLSSYLR